MPDDDEYRTVERIEKRHSMMRAGAKMTRLIFSFLPWPRSCIPRFINLDEWILARPAIASAMELTNMLYLEAEKLVQQGDVSRQILAHSLRTLTVLLGPFVPHICEELWQMMGKDESLFRQEWPSWDEEALVVEKV